MSCTEPIGRSAKSRSRTSDEDAALVGLLPSTSVVSVFCWTAGAGSFGSVAVGADPAGGTDATGGGATTGAGGGGNERQVELNGGADGGAVLARGLERPTFHGEDGGFIEAVSRGSDDGDVRHPSCLVELELEPHGATKAVAPCVRRVHGVRMLFEHGGDRRRARVRRRGTRCGGAPTRILRDGGVTEEEQRDGRARTRDQGRPHPRRLT